MGVKISELQEKTTANDTDVIVIVDDGTKKITKANLLKEINDKITNISTYSTEEINTGKKWIDGKTIYRKILTGNKTSAGELIINVGDNIDTVSILSARIDGNGHYLLPFYESVETFVRVEFDGNNIKIKSGTSIYSQGKVTIIAEYTKITE